MPSNCPLCGAATGPADRFCGDCGAALSPSAPVAAAEPAELLTDAGGEGATGAESVSDAAAPEVVSVDGAATDDASSDDTAGGGAAQAQAHDGGAAGAAPAREPQHAEEAESADVHSTADGSDASAGGSEAGGPEVAAGSSDAGEAGADSEATSDGSVDPYVSLEAPTADAELGVAEVAADADARNDESERRSATRAAGGTARGGSTGRLRNVPKALEPGTLLHSRYEVVRRIGGGGMGAVYLARDRNLGNAPRAVKEMIQQNIDESQHEKAINDFRRESMLLSSLEHPSIPTIYDYFYEDDSGRFYLVMKYISGGDFLARLRSAPNGRLDEKTVCDWAVQVADVLHYLHRQNPPIIYRDLKPANLMIDGNSGRVMLIDFGIARWVQKEEKGVTAVGTMGYAPPELFSGKVEPRSDIYSLGATIFHLLTGSDPQDNPLLIFDFNKNPRPRQLAPSLSNEMEQILMRAVEYKPENRFRSAAELRDTLTEHLEKLRTGQVTFGMTSGAAVSAALKTMQVEMVYCGFCGGRIAADDVYCAHCGQRQPMAVASAALRQARATAKLVVTGTTELDSSFLLQKESNLVGRSDPHSNIFPEVDLSRFDPQTKISRRHARIFRKGDVYLLEDLGSVNGTIVNDNVRLAPHQPRALESGDRLRLGETTLHFLIG
ncbi:MAG TPA: protein kinase [Pyrinomonadaceae bacterium]|nr:protein kinase [Pyrinomonadaceae bacterium]